MYELSDDPKRKEFLDDLFTFMQKRGRTLVPYCGNFSWWFHKSSEMRAAAPVPEESNLNHVSVVF
ncbi:hypothetical protein HPB47_024223 [Ixodes persulcatus]|uniref:Uncharacterized protein n=1 Tax=Ixodes persulcatus TaxID=34615 RepID=A0AC60Q5F9_IXOPE|nr:hypothetical protein HPB47_024223 [Ixodes persulcatus]